ncbi:hypothetical protein ACTHAL_001472 [Priestia flexa]|uniref:hypothetical protein n=1 Tax=Priestia flexa TaxID=86664 RepID=UPI003F855B85
MTLFKDMINKLTDLFTKNENSNIGKLIRVVSSELDSVQKTLETTEQWRDIDQAEGTTLDLIGENVGQPRDNSVDDEFRLLIKTKIFSNLSAGDIESVNQLLRIYLGEQFVSIQEGWNLEGTPFDGQGAMLFITVKGNGNVKGLPFKSTARIVGDGIGTTWDYIYERELVADRAYNRWLFDYEHFTGQQIAGSDEIQSNTNALYTEELSVTDTYLNVDVPYLIASDTTFTSVESLATAYSSSFTLSSSYSKTINDYPLTGGQDPNGAMLYQGIIENQARYAKAAVSYAICGDVTAGKD